MTTELEKIFKRLDTPGKIQDYLDALRVNFEPNGDMCSSPAVVAKRKSAHCIEGALLAAAALQYHGQPALILDLKANKNDFDHVICLFKKNGKWGALSKSNHAQLRYREPVYESPRELALSFFHEYLNKKGEKCLRSYSKLFDLKKYGADWLTSSDDLWEIANDLDESKHYSIMPKGHKLRPATPLEKYVGNVVEWSKKTGKRIKHRLPG